MHLDDNSKRLIIVGDLHGMSNSFQAMLEALDYSNSKDVLVHVGDITTRGPLEGSLEILEFMSTNNITGVRGNNDQKVLEWRGWLEWIHEMPGGREWLERMDGEWRDIVRSDPSHDVEAWNRGKRRWARGQDQAWWSVTPQEWIMHSSHYEVAREMAPDHYRYLIDLPIRLYVPSAHMFVMHAGMLPIDPRYPSTDKTKQPLARLPITDILEPVKGPSRIYGRDGLSPKQMNPEDPHTRAIDRLRNLQEIALLTQIPQNQIAWNALNMRRILKDGTVSRKHKKGSAWTNVWRDEMERCGGFASSELGLTDEQAAALNVTLPVIHGMKKHEDPLPCYPSTAIYGHAATRGLEIKRWSLGIDSGCVYGNQLTTLIVGGAGVNVKQPGWRVQRRALKDFDDDDDLFFEGEDYGLEGNHHIEYSPLFPFGDNHSARVVSMKCSPTDDRLASISQAHFSL
ncbi:Metallo-dependent phosphatase-like protein [Panaeolus papilionaceus]|nr:Metallo-dependent phosphatase-like protein [Panaeolus papilionaceus]